MRDLNDLLYFAAVVTHRGFSPAARALGVPKSSISRRIARLETDIGVRLLERSTRRFSVTEIGQEFYGHCRAVIADAEAAEEMVAKVHAEPTGLVRVSCPPGIAHGAIATEMPQFLATHPKLRLQLIVTNRRIDLIEEGVDIAIRARTNLTGDAAFQIKIFGQNRMLLVANPALVARYGAPETPSDIAKLPTIGGNLTPGRDSWTLTGLDGREQTIEHDPVLSCDDFTILLEAACAGTGFALLPESVCRDALNDGILRQILPDWHGGIGTIHLVFTSRRGLLPATRAVIDFLSKALSAGCKSISQKPE
jgi:DNA-binding transcriptional LysR family regulator